MGQILGPDKIGTLSENAGTITLQASTLTIGGQQKITGVLNIAGDFGSKNVNSLYYIYAVITGGVVSLVIEDDSRPNSVGPSGYVVWRLVGAFYVDGVMGFGSFVNIEGKPSSELFDAGPMGIATDAGAWNKGNVVKDQTRILRDGELALYRLSYSQGAGTQDGGNNIWLPPTNLAMDQVKIDPSGPAWANAVAPMYVSSSGIGKTGTMLPSLSLAGWAVAFDQPIGTNALSSFTNQSNGVSFSCGAQVWYPVVGWKNTPLVDL